MKNLVLAFLLLFFVSSVYCQTVGASSEGGKPLEAVGVKGPPAVDGELQKPAEPEHAKNAVITYLDLEYAFKNHPWTVMTKEKFAGEIKGKASELAALTRDIGILKESNIELIKEVDNVRPFYQTVYIEPETPVLPKQKEDVDAYEFNNLISFLIFASVERRAFSPIDSPQILEEIKDTIRENRAQIKEKELYIEKERVLARTNIEAEEQAEVQEILEDIYGTLKLYAQKRNIQIVVNKKDILYGQKPVDITLDFTDRLKKDKKKRPKTKDKKDFIKVNLD